MPEKTLPLPLSGAEVKQAVLDAVEQALSKDCYLHPSASYDFFDGKVTIYLKLNDMGREDVVKMEAKASSGTEPQDAVGTTVEMKFEAKPPNQVRVESGQPVPTSSGQKIKYQRPKAK